MFFFRAANIKEENIIDSQVNVYLTTHKREQNIFIVCV